MNNNDIFKKLRVALMLRDDQIVDILNLVDFRISKGEIGNFFRNADHPKYVECGDQVLRNFLNGLVIHLRGTKEERKDPMKIIEENRKQAAERFPKDLNTKTAGITNTSKNKPEKPKSKSNSKPAAKPTRSEVLGKTRFNIGKPKNK